MLHEEFFPESFEQAESLTTAEKMLDHVEKRLDVLIEVTTLVRENVPDEELTELLNILGEASHALWNVRNPGIPVLESIKR